MKHNYFLRKLVTATALVSVVSCVDNAYDLSNISLKITLGPDGVSLPLGPIDSLTVDSLIRQSEIKNIIVDDGFMTYKLDSTIHNNIGALSIDPILNVIPAVSPVDFRFTDAALPVSFPVEGSTSEVSVTLPAFDFTQQSAGRGVHLSKDLDIAAMQGTTIGAGYALPVLSLSGTEDFPLSLSNIPQEIASVEKLYFSGTAQGTPVRAKLALGALASSVQGGRATLTLTLPEAYSLSDGSSTYNRTLTLERTFTGSDVELTLYIASRDVSESLSGQRLSLPDNIQYSFSYTGISNGRTISGASPVFTLTAEPQIGDADIVTTDITPVGSDFTLPLDMKIEGLNGIREVNYLAFLPFSTNTLRFKALRNPLPLRGTVDVFFEFPRDFTIGTLSGTFDHVAATTLDALTSGGIPIFLKGLTLRDDEANVVNGTLSISQPIQVHIRSRFPSGRYKLSNLKPSGTVPITLIAEDLVVKPDVSDCQIKAELSGKPIQIVQQIDQRFRVPDEVSAITRAEVSNAQNGSDASFALTLDLENSPIQHCYFDDIDIVLPKFLEAEHPNFDPKTHTIHIDRIEYRGSRVTIARATLRAIGALPVIRTQQGRQAQLSGEFSITATVHVPDDAVIDGLENETITLVPGILVSPLQIEQVTGKVDIDLGKYFTPSTIYMEDLRTTLDNHDLEANLLAPQLSLLVENPVGVAMIGDIRLQPYNMAGEQLDPVVIEHISIEPADGATSRITRLFVTDGTTAPEGYTLCRVEDLASLVKIIPAKIDVTFDLEVDKSREQSFVITDEDYPFLVNYAIKIPLKFQSGAVISYVSWSNVSDTFDDLENYEITAKDILVEVNARTTIPIDFDVTVELLDADKKAVEGAIATVLDRVHGYNAQTDGAYKQSKVNVRLDLQNGDLQLLKRIATIRYTVHGEVIGTDTGLTPEQYFKANLTLRLKKGITINLDTI